MAAESKISLLGLSSAVVLILLITSKAGAVPLYGNTSGGEAEQTKESDQTCPDPNVRISKIYVSGRALRRTPVCNGKIYGNCIVPVGSGDRPCNYYNRCIRHQWFLSCHSDQSNIILYVFFYMLRIARRINIHIYMIINIIYPFSLFYMPCKDWR